MTRNMTSLGEVAQFINGAAFKPEDWGDSGFPIIRIQNLTDESKPFNRTTRTVAEKLQVHPGDLLVSWSATLGVFTWKRPEIGLLNQHIFRVIPDESKVDKAYLRLALSGALSAMQKHLHGATMQHVNRGEFLGTPLYLPPLEEQRRIAAILDQAETLRTQRRTALALLDSLTQSLFLEMFGDPVANPKGWSMSTIGDLAEVQGGLQVTSARKNLPVEVPYLRVANVYRGVLDLSEIKTIRATPAEIQRTTLVKDDLLVVEGHGNPNEIGRAALWNGEIEQCVHQNHLIRARFDCTKVEPVFASEYVNSPGGRQHLLRAGKSTSGLNTISVSNVRETPIALPPLPLQQTFATRIAAIEALKATHRRALAALDELFASLQQRAFTGAL